MDLSQINVNLRRKIKRYGEHCTARFHWRRKSACHTSSYMKVSLQEGIDAKWHERKFPSIILVIVLRSFIVAILDSRYKNRYFFSARKMANDEFYIVCSAYLWIEGLATVFNTPCRLVFYPNIKRNNWRSTQNAYKQWHSHSQNLTIWKKRYYHGCEANRILTFNRT